MGANLKRKLFAIVMTLVLVVSMSAVVFAADESPSGGSDPAQITNLDTTMSGTTGMKVTATAKNAAKYRFSYWPTGGTKKYVNTTSKSTTITGLKAGGTYVFTVSAFNDAGQQSEYYYNSWSYRFMRTASPTATAKSGKVTVKWSKVSGASGYDVRYGYSGGKTYTKSVSGTSTSFSAKSKGKTVFYQVRPYKKLGGKKYVGAWSSKKTVKAK